MDRILSLFFASLTLLFATQSASAQNFALSGIAEGVYEHRFKADGDKGMGSFYLPGITLGGAYHMEKGWTLGAEAEFTYGCPLDEPVGERSMEFSLSEFYIEKSFAPYINIKVGYFALPVGYLGVRDTPADFLTVSPPVSEASLLPVTWKQTGVSLFGEVGGWGYELMLASGLSASPVSAEDGAAACVANPYEMDFSNGLSVAARAEYAFADRSHVALSAHSCAYRDTVAHRRSHLNTIAADFHFEDENAWRVSANTLLRTQNHPMEWGKNAFGAGVESGFNLLSLSVKQTEKARRLYAFARYDFTALRETVSHVAAGFNFQPIDRIVVKAQYLATLPHGHKKCSSGFSMSIAYVGDFF